MNAGHSSEGALAQDLALRLKSALEREAALKQRLIELEGQLEAYLLQPRLVETGHSEEHSAPGSGPCECLIVKEKLAVTLNSKAYKIGQAFVYTAEKGGLAWLRLPLLIKNVFRR